MNFMTTEGVLVSSDNVNDTISEAIIELVDISHDPK